MKRAIRSGDLAGVDRPLTLIALPLKSPTGLPPLGEENSREPRGYKMHKAKGDKGRAPEEDAGICPGDIDPLALTNLGRVQARYHHRSVGLEDLSRLGGLAEVELGPGRDPEGCQQNTGH